MGQVQSPLPPVKGGEMKNSITDYYDNHNKDRVQECCRCPLQTLVTVVLSSHHVQLEMGCYSQSIIL